MKRGAFNQKRLIRGLVTLLAVLQVVTLFPLGIGALKVNDVAAAKNDIGGLVDGTLGVIVNGSVVTGEINNVSRDASVDISFNFSLPDDNGIDGESREEYVYNENDFFEISLPFALEFLNDWPRELKQTVNGVEHTIGYVTFETDSDSATSKAVVKLSKTVDDEELSALEGNFALKGKLKENVVTDGNVNPAGI